MADAASFDNHIKIFGLKNGYAYVILDSSMSNFKKAIFLYFCLFNIEQMTLRNCWIRSQVFWCQKWSFCHNDYLRYLQQFDQFKLGLPNCTSQYCYLNGLFNIVYSNDMFLIKIRRWLYSNRRPLESEATTPLTEPKPMPKLIDCFYVEHNLQDTWVRLYWNIKCS